MAFEKTRYLGGKVKSAVSKNLSDSTALLVVASPIQAAVDTIGLEYLGRAADKLGLDYIQLSAMSDTESIGGKVGVAALTYCGIGWLYGASRDLSRKVFNITQESKERIQWLHDWIYTAAFSSTVLLCGYLGSNYFTGKESDGIKIATALTISAATQTIRGPLIGYSIDSFRDLLGFNECTRSTYPNRIKQLGTKAKKGVATAAVAASIGVMALLYATTPDEWSNPNQPQNHTQSQLNTPISDLEEKLE